HKKDGACQRLVVTGCLAERYRNDLIKEIPEIDAVLGTGEVPEIVRAIAGASSLGVAPLKFFRGGSSNLQPPTSNVISEEARSALPTYIYDADTPRVFAT